MTTCKASVVRLAQAVKLPWETRSRDLVEAKDGVTLTVTHESMVVLIEHERRLGVFGAPILWYQEEPPVEPPQAPVLKARKK